MSLHNILGQSENIHIADSTTVESNPVRSPLGKPVTANCTNKSTDKHNNKLTYKPVSIQYIPGSNPNRLVRNKFPKKSKSRIVHFGEKKVAKLVVKRQVKKGNSDANIVRDHVNSKNMEPENNYTVNKIINCPSKEQKLKRLNWFNDAIKLVETFQCKLTYSVILLQADYSTNSATEVNAMYQKLWRLLKLAATTIIKIQHNLTRDFYLKGPVSDMLDLSKLDEEFDINQINDRVTCPLMNLLTQISGMKCNLEDTEPMDGMANNFIKEPIEESPITKDNTVAGDNSPSPAQTNDPTENIELEEKVLDQFDDLNTISSSADIKLPENENEMDIEEVDIKPEIESITPTSNTEVTPEPYIINKDTLPANEFTSIKKIGAVKISLVPPKPSTNNITIKTPEGSNRINKVGTRKFIKISHNTLKEYQANLGETVVFNSDAPKSDGPQNKKILGKIKSIKPNFIKIPQHTLKEYMAKIKEIKNVNEVNNLKEVKTQDSQKTQPSKLILNTTRKLMPITGRIDDHNYALGEEKDSKTKPTGAAFEIQKPPPNKAHVKKEIPRKSFTDNSDIDKKYLVFNMTTVLGPTQSVVENSSDVMEEAVISDAELKEENVEEEILGISKSPTPFEEILKLKSVELVVPPVDGKSKMKKVEGRPVRKKRNPNYPIIRVKSLSKLQNANARSKKKMKVSKIEISKKCSPADSTMDVEFID